MTLLNNGQNEYHLLFFNAREINHSASSYFFWYPLSWVPAWQWLPEKFVETLQQCYLYPCPKIMLRQPLPGRYTTAKVKQKRFWMVSSHLSQRLRALPGEICVHEFLLAYNAKVMLMYLESRTSYSS